MDVTAGKQDLVEHVGAGQVGHQHTKGNGDKQQGLEFLHDTQKQQEAGDDDHHQALPVLSLKNQGETGAVDKIQNSFHSASLHYWMTHSSVPDSTVAPFWVLTEAMVPSQGLMISFSIFMASRIIST